MNNRWRLGSLIRHVRMHLWVLGFTFSAGERGGSGGPASMGTLRRRVPAPWEGRESRNDLATFARDLDSWMGGAGFGHF
jgi:hypothetical protein